MATGVNKATIVGYLGQDPEIRYTSAGKAVATISVATTESWKDKGTGEKMETTEWHKIVFFGRLAEVVGEYLGKGSLVYVEGKLNTKKWQDKEGHDRWTTQIIANTMQMLGGGKARGSSGGSNSGHDQQAQKPTGNDEPPDFEDDIPF